MLNATAVQLFLNLTAGLDIRRRDPLKFFRWCSNAQARIFRYLAMGLEVFARFGNAAGKTYGAAFGVVAMLRAIGTLDGVELPKLRPGAVWWVLTKTRRAQVDAAQAAYLEAIGAYPHDIAWDNRAKHYIDSIWIATRWCQHGNGHHCSTCSRIVFHCEQSGVESLLGGRVDGIHSDEPPNEKIWREARSRIRAGGHLYLLITATPLYRKDWFWIAIDFANCLDRPNRGRVEVVSDLTENRFLPEATRRKLIENWRGDILFDARRYGMYVDAEGHCPFKIPLIQSLEHGTRSPKLIPVKIETERDTSRGVVIAHQKVIVEQFWPRERNETYWVLGDPSTGIEDAKHDPAGIHVYARRRPRLVARYEGYTAAWGLGVLAGKLARFYNSAWVDIETNGGYGKGAFSSLRQRARYTNVNIREIETSPGKFRPVPGWDTTAPLRGQFIALIQQWLEEAAAGTADPIMPSSAMLSCLRNITVDSNGKYLAAEGRHDEDFILLGRGLWLLVNRPEVPLPVEDRRVTMRRVLEQELRRPVISEDHDDPENRRVRTRR